MRIDHPAEDDTPRVTPESRADGTAPAAEYETPDRVACAVKYRETVDAAYREYQATREWDEALPALREAWENHEKKWTYPERTGPTVQTEVPGAWRGDGGRYLAPDANAEVIHGCARIREVGETVITPAMRRIEAEDPDRHLAGLEYRLKSETRLKEKVAGELRAFRDITPTQALSSVPDSVRFTLCYDEGGYTDGVRADTERLKSQGFEQIKLKNSWTSDQYRGINSQWRHPESGVRFEVQFHTQASFEAKQLSHKAYERLRSPQTTRPEASELEAFQRQVCARVVVPPGATEIENYSLEKRDGYEDNLLRDRQ
jgi:hypothetical protein